MILCIIKEKQEAAKQRHLQGFHEQLAAQQAEAEKEMKQEAARAQQAAAAPRVHQDGQEGETEEERGGLR